MESGFDPIAAEYAFFEEHSSEAQETIKVLAPYLNNYFSTTSEIRLLDVGAGTGTFTAKLLESLDLRNKEFHITLVEPGVKSRQLAVARLQKYSSKKIEQYDVLQRVPEMNFNLILANHSLYFVDDLKATLTDLLKRVRTGGLMAAAMAGKNNPLIDIWELGYSLDGSAMPYSISNDLQELLKDSTCKFEKVVVDYLIEFQDTSNGRQSILRFLLKEEIVTRSESRLIEFFDTYKLQGSIVMPTRFDLYLIRG